jgi:integrase
VLAAVHSFLTYWKVEGHGPQELQLYQNGSAGGRKAYSFLAHVSAQQPQPERRLQVRGPKTKPPKIINFEPDFQRLIAAANSARDRLLLSGMFDGGLRISQCLGMLHEDLDIARKRVRIIRRTNNVNGALSKQRAEFAIDVPKRFFDYYAQSLVDEQLALGIDSDYLFVNLQPQNRGRPMRYANAVQVVSAIGDRAGIPLHPHMLRHTHGTALAKDGWSAPQIAKRLGQSSAISADKYIHLADDDISDKYWQSNLARRES